MGLLEPQGSENEYHPQASATSLPLHLNREGPQPHSRTSFFLEQTAGSHIQVPQRLAHTFARSSCSQVPGEHCAHVYDVFLDAETRG